MIAKSCVSSSFLWKVNDHNHPILKERKGKRKKKKRRKKNERKRKRGKKKEQDLID